MNKRKILPVTIALTVLTGAYLGKGCAAAQPACAIVDIADYACDFVTVEYRDSNGKLRRVRIPKDEMQGLALKASRDAGAD
jgi:hypothetical protein